MRLPSLDTLVSDIYKLFDGHECDPKKVEEFGRDLANIVSNRLEDNRRDNKPTLRMSNVGKPDRQIWYDINDPGGGEKLEPHVRLKFLIGDVWEAVLLFLAEESGHKVTHKQEQVELNGIIGHIDAMIDGIVVDVKSASTPSFNKFKTGSLREDDGFGYMEQIAGYATALKSPGAGFLAGDKTLGHLCLMEIDKDEIASIKVEDRIEHIKKVIADPDIPERCYEPKEEGSKNPKTGQFNPNGNLSLATGCSYCSRKFTCWSDANNGVGLRVFSYSSGPKFFTRIESEPKVPEITF